MQLPLNIKSNDLSHCGYNEWMHENESTQLNIQQVFKVQNYFSESN